VRRADELDAALGDRARGLCLELRPDLVDDDDLGHVVLDRLDHHLVLQRRRPDLHPARLADGRVRDVAVAGDLVRGVDDDHALAEVVGQDARRLAEHGGLADARPAHDEDRLPALDEVADDLDRPEHRPADAQRQPDDLAIPVPDRRDAVERPLDARAVVVAERPDVVDDVLDVALGDLPVEEHDLAVRVAGLGPPAQVQDHLDERLAVGQRMDRVDDLGRQRHEERVDVVGRLTAPFGLGHVGPPAHRTPAGTSAGSATRTRVSFIRSVTLARSSKPLASSSLSIGDS
jgi:hypothetical protein